MSLQSRKGRGDRCDDMMQRAEPTYTAWLNLKSRAEGLLDHQPHASKQWYVPGYYRDAAGHSQAKQGLQDDANAVYELALCWQPGVRAPGGLDPQSRVVPVLGRRSEAAYRRDLLQLLRDPE